MYGVSNCCFSAILLLGYDRVLEKRFGGPGKVLEFFGKQESRNPAMRTSELGHYTVEMYPCTALQC